MKHTQGARKALVKQKVIVAAVASAFASSAFALDFQTESGWSGSISTTLSASSSWRAQNPDKELMHARNATQAGLVPGISPATSVVGAAIAAVAPNTVVVSGSGGSGSTPAVAPQGYQLGVAAGYTGGTWSDDAQYNYRKNDQFTELYKAVVDFRFSKDDFGGLVRAKAWYDNNLNNHDVKWGNQASGFKQNLTGDASPLSDRGFARLNRFEGVHLLDAYVYKSFDLGEMPAQIRIGRQAVNWGESVFFQGVNQISHLDISALRKAGTEIKEALLPIWSLTANVGLPGGASLDAFYQFKWEPSNLDACGTYWAVSGTNTSSSIGACNLATPLGGSNPSAYTTLNSTGLMSLAGAGNPFNGGQPFQLGSAMINGPEPSDSGQFGVSFKFPVEALDTEFGLYAMKIHSRTPVIGNRLGGTATTLQSAALAAALAGAGAAAQLVGLDASVRNGAQSWWEYPEDIKIYGLSAATTLGGVSWGAELSFQHDVPVLINGNDMILAALLAGPATAALNPGAAGPAGARFAAARATIAPGTLATNGVYVAGWDRFDKTQFQLNGVATLPAMLGAQGGLVIGEAAFQWNDVPTNKNGIRYGRAFIYGTGSHSTLSAAALTGAGAGNNCANQTNPSTGGLGFNPQPDGCKNDGYVNDFAWGYRVRASLDYSGIFDTSWNFTPSVFFLHDVEGYSMDSQINEGRQTLSLNARFSLNKEHNIDLNYTTYSDSADYDAFKDRDNYSVSYSYTF
jgi:hypothetical protein